MWEGTPIQAEGGVRARNQQRAYLDRVANGDVARPAPEPAGPAPVPSPRGRHRSAWQLPERPRTDPAAQPA
jgi:RNA polymerase sigma factor for flagellar operon FliA